MPRHTTGMIVAVLAGALIATTAGAREAPAPTCTTSDLVTITHDIPPGPWRAAVATASDAAGVLPVDVQTCAAAPTGAAGVPGVWIALLLGLVVLGLVVLAAIVPAALSQRRAGVSISVAQGATLILGSNDFSVGATAPGRGPGYAEGYVDGAHQRPPEDPPRLRSV